MADRPRSFEERVGEYAALRERAIVPGLAAELGPPPESGPVADRELVERWRWRDPLVPEAEVWAAVQAGRLSVEDATRTLYPMREETYTRGRPGVKERVREARRLAALAGARSQESGVGAGVGSQEPERGPGTTSHEPARSPGSRSQLLTPGPHERSELEGSY